MFEAVEVMLGPWNQQFVCFCLILIDHRQWLYGLIDGYAKDVGPGEVQPSCSFYHAPLQP